MVFGTFWLWLGWGDIQTRCVQPASWRTGERAWQAVKVAGVLAWKLKIRWTYSQKNEPFVESCHSVSLKAICLSWRQILCCFPGWVSPGSGSSLLPEHWLRFSCWTNISVCAFHAESLPCHRSLALFGAPFLLSTACRLLDASSRSGRHTASAKDLCNEMPLCK